MTSPDFRVARVLVLSTLALLVIGVLWRQSISAHDLVDTFFLGLVGTMTVGALIMSRSRVQLVEREPGGQPDLVIIRNGLRSHRVPLGAVISIDAVNPGDRRLVGDLDVRRTQFVRFGLLDRPSVMAVALLREPALRARSAGAAGIDPLIAGLRTAAGLGQPPDQPPDHPPDHPPDRRMPE